MTKLKGKIKKLMALCLATTVFATTIDTKAFADTYMVTYNGTGYETLEEAITAFNESDATEHTITLNQSVEWTTAMVVETGEIVTINGSSITEEIIVTINTEIVAMEIAEGASVTLNNISVLGNTYAGIATEHNSSVIINNGTMNLNDTEIGQFNLNEPAIRMNGESETAQLIMNGNSRLYSLVNNDRLDAGGAVLCSGNCYISGGTFEANNARSGGCIAGKNSQTNVTVSDAYFYDNDAVRGAIAVSNVYVNNCTFSSNKSYYGGTSIVSNGNCEVYNSTFINEDNCSQGRGVLALSGNAILAGIEISNSAENPKNCGGINVEGGTTTIKTGELTDTAFGVVVAENNIFENNYSGKGGVLHVSASGKAVIEQAQILNNKANEGGAIYNQGIIDLYNVTIRGNSANSTNSINENRVKSGDGIYNAGTLNLYGSVVIEDQIMLAAGKYITVKEELENYVVENKTIKVAMEEAVSESFRPLVQYEVTKKEGKKDVDISVERAYRDSLKEIWYLESVSEEKNENIASQNNQIGLFTEIYEQDIVCVNSEGDAIKGVTLELFV